jgi:phosphoglycolate phosphatase-like HAD superfamily hydrolase
MKLFIFDFDGTLVDSRKLILESHRVIFAEPSRHNRRRRMHDWRYDI